MDNSDVVLALRDLSVGYGGRIVLEAIHLEIRAGELWFFIGPNGMGKTTLLRAILGEIPARGGQIWLSPEVGKREHLGFIPQNCDLNPTLPTTVREFVSLGFTGARMSRMERAESLSWALDKVGLEGAETRDYWTLSGGQRQRVLVARALVRRPRLLILDEPTKGLDLSTEHAFLELISDLNRKEGLTVLFVAHDLNLAARFSTHAALFGNGRVLAGESHAVLTSENLAAIYGIPIVVRREPSGAMSVRISGKGKEE